MQVGIFPRISFRVGVLGSMGFVRGSVDVMQQTDGIRREQQARWRGFEILQRIRRCCGNQKRKCKIFKGRAGAVLRCDEVDLWRWCGFGSVEL